jgi:hypothetical protein
MAVFTVRRCVHAGALVVVLVLGIAIGMFSPVIWPFSRAAPADNAAPAGNAAPSGTAPLSAPKIVEDWGQGVPSHPGSIERWTLTAGPEKGTGHITTGTSNDGPPTASAFLVFRTGQKFEEVWKRYAKKCGQDEAKQCLPREVPRGPESMRVDYRRGKESDEFMAVDFGGIAPDKFGGEPGVRESHFAYYTEGYAVHVVIEEVGSDRNVNDKGSVKVCIYAAVR